MEEGLFGEIPERIKAYLDYDAIAHDLCMDYSETTIDGTCYIYHSNYAVNDKDHLVKRPFHTNMFDSNKILQ